MIDELPATPLLTILSRPALLAAAVALSACGAVAGQAPAYQVDRECQSAVPFASAYEQVRARDDPRVEEARAQLASATSAEATRVSLRRLAEVLRSYEADLDSLPAPPGPTEHAALTALISADEHMATQSLLLGQDPTGLFADHAQAWQTAAGARQRATQALALRVALIRAKCD